MFNVRLAGGHLYGKQLFTWLSLVVSLMASFCDDLFPLGVLDGVWDLIQSVSEGFRTYCSINLTLSFSLSTNYIRFNLSTTKYIMVYYMRAELLTTRILFQNIYLLNSKIVIYC